MPLSRGSIAFLLIVVASHPGALGAQAIGQGFELERQGRLDQAATLYVAVLRSDPTNLSALLGLERVLPQLNRLAELLPAVQRARARDSVSVDLRSLELRTYALMNEPDSVAAAARRWVAFDPASPAPWREWAIALEDLHRFDAARAVLLEGRRALGGAGENGAAFAIELAELHERIGEWPSAAAEWATVVSEASEQIPNAVSQLDDAPTEQQEKMLRVLTGSGTGGKGAGSVHPQWLAGELLLDWGKPERGWDLIAATVGHPGDAADVVGGEAEARQAVSELRRFAERAGQGGTPAHRRAGGLALARYADLVPPPLSTRARAQAARALIDAGDAEAAQSVLARLAGDQAAPPDVQVLAQAALVEAFIRGGQLDSAQARLEHAALTGDDRARLTLELARAWIAAGKLDRAEQAIGTDSSVEALAARGLVLMYRGDLKRAAAAFQAAGPYAGDRAAATERTTWVALLQGIAVERDPELGQALLLLARGDSSGAVSALRSAAAALPPRGGRYDVFLLAGQVAARLDGAHDAEAAALFEQIVTAQDGAPQSAAPPAAELAWARLLARAGRAPEATSHLEHLILTYPQSAVIPEARRELERLKGAIPRS